MCDTTCTKQAPLMLEVGKSYLDRSGNQRKITSFDDRQGLYYGTPAIVQCVQPTWLPDGFYRSDRLQSAFDLVTEVRAEPVPIPHPEIIDALLKGKEVQWWNEVYWANLVAGPEGLRFVLGRPNYKFRIKPDSIVRFFPVIKTGVGLGYTDRADMKRAYKMHTLDKVLRIELDPDLTTVTATLEAP